MSDVVKAKWSLNVSKRSVDADGTARVDAELSDDGVKALVLQLRINPDRAVEVRVLAEPGANLTGLTAWSNV